jgi:hypothetical protein
LKELGKCHLSVEASEVLEQGPPLAELRHGLEVVEHDVAAHTVEFDVTSARKEGEAFVDLLADRPATYIEECSEPLVEAERAMLLIDEVDHRQARLSGRLSQTAAELLRKDRRALCRTQ